MPRAIPFLLCVATVLGLSTAATATTTVPNGYDVVTRQELSSGVEYLKLTNPGAPVVAHVAHIAPGAPVDLRVVNAKEKIPTSLCQRMKWSGNPLRRRSLASAMYFPMPFMSRSEAAITRANRGSSRRRAGY